MVARISGAAVKVIAGLAVGAVIVLGVGLVVLWLFAWGFVQ